MIVLEQDALYFQVFLRRHRMIVYAKEKVVIQGIRGTFASTFLQPLVSVIEKSYFFPRLLHILCAKQRIMHYIRNHY